MTETFSLVSVVGLGYIGLPTAAVIAKQGVHVVGVDVDPRAVSIINSGRGHIVEPDLDEVLHRVVESGHLRATTTVEPADVFVIAVPTPFHEDHVPDLSYIEAATRSIAPHLRAGNLVILESTSPVGATERMTRWMAEMRPDLTFPLGSGEADVNVAHCPERVLPGQVLAELVENDRIVGGMTSRCAERASHFYRIFVKGACIETTARTAEMCKLTENAFRDVNIAFANELSLICDQLDVNVWELIRLANCHPRVNILQPGPGVGGHCIAVDPWFIVHSAPERSRVIRTAREVNDGKPGWVVDQVKAAVEGRNDPVIACFGLAFKPDIDDLRESPALAIVERLAALDLGRLLVVEPFVEELPRCLQGRAGVEKVAVREALEQANVVVMLVNHREFYQISQPELAGKTLIDTRGVWQ